MTPNSRPIPWSWSWPLGTILPDFLLQRGNGRVSFSLSPAVSQGRRPSLLLEFLGEGDFFIYWLLSQESFVDLPRTSVAMYEELHRGADCERTPAHSLMDWWQLLTPGADSTITWGKGDGLCAGAGSWLDVRFPTAL